MDIQICLQIGITWQPAHSHDFPTAALKLTLGFDVVARLLLGSDGFLIYL